MRIGRQKSRSLFRQVFLPVTRKRRMKLKKREYKKLYSPCAFIFLVYRSRGALDNVHPNGNDFNTADVRWRERRRTLHACSPASRRTSERASAQLHACKWSAVSGRLVQKPCVRWIPEKKASYGLIVGNSNHWIRTPRHAANSDRATRKKFEPNCFLAVLGRPLFVSVNGRVY